MKIRTIILLIFLPLFLHADLNTTLQMTDEISHRFRKDATKQYHRFLNWVDSSFSENADINKSSYKKIRESRLLIVLSLKDNTHFTVHLRGKIILPQLKNRVELTFSQDDSKALDNQRAVSVHDDVIKDKNLHVGLKYYLYREKQSTAYGKLNLRLTPPFGPYIKLGIDRNYLTNHFFETTFNHALYYYLNGNRLSASTAVSFFKPLNNNYWIGQGNKLYWKGDQSLHLNNTLLFYQIFNLNNRMIYKIAITNAYDRNEHFRHENFELSSGYFHRFNKWFFAEMIPKFRKSRSKQYRNEYLISFNFGMLLGK